MDVQFGFHTVCGKNVNIFDERLAERKNRLDRGYTVTYGAKPLTGTSVFEVEIASYAQAYFTGSFTQASLCLGVMRCRTGTDMRSVAIPKSTLMAPNYCVWTKRKVYNNLEQGVGLKAAYGNVDLYDLRVGDRVGLKLSCDGELEFTVNGQEQGVAAKGVYLSGYEVYAVVDHVGPHEMTRITRAVLGK